MQSNEDEIVDKFKEMFGFDFGDSEHQKAIQWVRYTYPGLFPFWLDNK